MGRAKTEYKNSHHMTVNNLQSKTIKYNKSLKTNFQKLWQSE